MREFWQDIRYAARQLRRSPGFTLTALLTLGLGIGVTAAVYSVVQTVLLEPLPYPEQDRLIGLAWTFPHEKPNAEQAGSSADFIRDHMQSFSSTAVIDEVISQANLSVGGSVAKQINSARVSEGYFRTLGVLPVIGRGFLAEEDKPGGPRIAVLSYGLWSSLLHRDPSIVGKTIRLNEENYVVVGVMPHGFAVTAETAPGVLASPDLWQPLQLSVNDPGYDGDNYQMIARMKPAVSLSQVQAQLNLLNEPFYKQYPYNRRWLSDDKSLHEFRVWKLQDTIVGDVRRSLLTVMGAVVAVLLVACLNLSGLMIARVMRRSRELSVRTVLGATRLQLARLLACEGLLLAIGGAALAFFVTRVSVGLLLHRSPLAIPDLRGEPGIGLLLGVVLATALASSAVFAFLPTCMVLHTRARSLVLGGVSLGDTPSSARISRLVILVQVALAMVLVSTASLLMGTFVKLRALPSGVEPKRLTVFQVSLKGERYAKTLPTSQFVAHVTEQLRSTPGVESAAAVNGLPLDRGLNMGAYPEGRKEIERTVEFRAVTPGYFRTMGISLLTGRDIADSDRSTGAPVVVIGETAARKWWPGRSPIGEIVRFNDKMRWRVVGVVSDVQQHSLVEREGIVIYGPMVQLSDEFTSAINGWFSTSFAVRTGASVSVTNAIQSAVAKADPEIPVAKLTTMQAVIDDSIQAPRFYSMLAFGFSGFAVVLTTIGLFGLLSYQVTQRTREIGVRMALGADRFAILRTFLLRGVGLAAIGLAAGAVASWWTRVAVSHLLSDAGVDVTRMDTWHAASVSMHSSQAMMMSVIVILCAAALASWLPARRAAAVEPMQALRSE